MIKEKKVVKKERIEDEEELQKSEEEGTVPRTAGDVKVGRV